MAPHSPLRRWSSLGLVVAMLVLMGGCSSIPRGAWRVTPLEYDNAMEEGRADRIDVTYPMANITGDTEGGFWTESSSSWLHVGADGETLRRFNDDLFITVSGIAAVSPTVLVVSRTDRENPTGTGTGLFLYDTDAATWDAVTVDATTIGDVVVDADGRIIFVDFLSETLPEPIDTPVDRSVPAAFAVRAVDSNGVQTTVLEPDDQSRASAVAIDVDSEGIVYVSTGRETFTVAPDGSRMPLGSHPAGHPVLAVNPAGAVLAPATRDGGAEVEWALTRGSSEARDVMAQDGLCEQTGGRGLSLRQDGTELSLPFSCGVKGAAWLDSSTFVVSIGTEEGAILTTVRRPEAQEPVAKAALG